MTGALHALAPWLVLPAILAIALETARGLLPLGSALVALVVDVVAVVGDVFSLPIGTLLALPLVLALVVRGGRQARHGRSTRGQGPSADGEGATVAPPRRRRAA